MGPRWSPRGGDPRTPSGLEGSSGSGDVGRRGVAGADSLIPNNTCGQKAGDDKTKRMSYLVLARKWRPRTFADVVGQPHVVRALENALGSGRIHHAFLFAGTRGVGKTTIARILAKALNCESGVSAEPCGECGSCLAVDEGRFLDLIEIDAASRTGVDDMRDLLANVQYTPSGGRFKVYLIDEVHMLSKSSFNALLKTLEEPPPHVKFLFATTDPQKIPVTVLSRCLQFNLKRLATNQIVERMGKICEAEDLDADPAALKRLARAAAGSMRDALSLLDQALAYGAERLVDDDVATMLGSMDRHRIIDLLNVLVAGDGAGVMNCIQQLDELVPDYETVLEELATALQRIAVIQLAGSDALEDEDELEALADLAGRTAPEQVQLLYDIAVTSRRDIGLAPDPRIGFEMSLLRMLAFRPADASNTGAPAATLPAAKPARSSPSAPTRSAAGAAPEVKNSGGPASPEELQDWPAFVSRLDLDGGARQLAENIALESSSPFELRLVIDRRNEPLLTDKLKGRLVEAIQRKMGSDVRVQIGVTDMTGETTAGRVAKQARNDLDDAKDAIESDPNVREFVDSFGGEIVPDSIQPVRKDSSPD
jgi:DNA polymerase-3 subunit gamma/tau